MYETLDVVALAHSEMEEQGIKYSNYLQVNNT